MSARPSKWYRSHKRILRPFLCRIWWGSTPMRGGRHLARCVRMSVMMAGPARHDRWQRMFEPVRVRSKVWRSRRAVPYWSNGYDRIHPLTPRDD